MTPRLPPAAALDWSEAGEPRAREFGDVYFSAEGGLAEAEAVFLAGCGLPERWRGRDRFAIGELGFGSGLNVLAVWRAWRSARNTHAILHIASIEAFPLAKADAARALARFPELADLAQRLLARWPVRAYAPQRLCFPDDGLVLTLHTGDAAAVLSGMVGAFDCWFLDGFAPSRNAAMWSDEVFAQMARLSAPGTRAATFSVAGHVRRGLERVGFSVEKRPGFAAKRERLEARFDAAPARDDSLLPHASTQPRRVAVLGAGIAGAACAQALSRRGVETVVLDEAPVLGAGASGNPAALVMPRLDRGGVLREFFLAAYLDVVSRYEELGVFLSRGVEERAGPRGAAALDDLLADPPLPEDWFHAGGVGAFHPRAGLIEPRRACAAMLEGADVLFEARVQALERSGDAWVLRAPDGRARLKVDAVVITCGAALNAFAPARFLPLELTRGQIEWGAGAPPPHTITQGHYLAAYKGGVLFGATFDRVDDGATTASADDAQARNLAALEAMAPEVAATLGPLQSRSALRAALPDRAPVAGLLPDADAWRAHYAGLAQGRKVGGAPPRHEGLYVLGGLGARGFVSAPLLGERIVSEMFGEPQVLSRPALDALHPARFLVRAMKRGGV